MKRCYFFLILLLLPLTSVKGVECGWGADLEYLLWRPHSCFLDYASPLEVFDVNQQLTLGNVIRIDPDYRSGFRVGISRGWCCWDVAVHYTWMRTKDRGSAFGEDNTLNYTRFGSSNAMSFFTGGVTHAEVEYKVTLDQIALEFGRTYSPICHLDLRVLGGLKYAQLNQNYSANYFAFLPEEVFLESDAHADLDDYSLFVGIQGMLNYPCYYGVLHVEGRLAFGPTLGFSKRRTVEADGIVDDTFVEGINLVDRCSLGHGLLDGAIGARFNGCCPRGCRSYDLYIGYEIHTWIGIPDFLADYQINPAVNYLQRNLPNFSFEGFVLRATVYY